MLIIQRENSCTNQSLPKQAIHIDSYLAGWTVSLKSYKFQVEVLETIGKGRNAFAKNNIPGKLSRAGDKFKQHFSRATKLVR
jgi:hypothetical protein